VAKSNSQGSLRKSAKDGIRAKGAKNKIIPVPVLIDDLSKDPGARDI
jgi:hypothetical protein